jgi:hypothetical protein
MASDLLINGGSSTAGKANVDANYNLNVNLPTVVEQAGFTQLSGNLAEATDPTGIISQKLRVSAQGRIAVGQPVMLLNEVFNYTTLNSAIMTAPVTTMTVTVAAGTLNLNASSITTVSTVARVSTYAFFPLQADFATFATWDMLLTQNPQVNTTIEAGFIQCTASTLPTDGAFFRFDTTGTLKAVINNNGTEISSAALTAPSANVMHKYKIVVENDRVLYYIDGACQAEIAAPVALGMPMYAQAQPWTARVYNGGVAPALANQVKIGYLFVGLQDAAALGKDNATISAIGGKMGSQGQSGMTMGSTALLTNSLAPGAGAVMTNTTAALGVGLGGQFAALPTLAVSTDGILCSYLNTIPTAAIPGKTLYIRGVKIHGVVTTVLVGNATPVIYAYSLAYGHNALTLATTESATAKAPRRVPLGFESYGAAAALGTMGSTGGVYMPFNAPIAVNPGEYVAICAKNIGAVTTTGVITFYVAFDSYWE